MSFSTMVNDRFGHQEGDRLLQHIASLLRREARVSDVIARVGGDEFALIQPETEVAGGLIAAERIRSTMRAEPVRHCRGRNAAHKRLDRNLRHS